MRKSIHTREYRVFLRLLREARKAARVSQEEVAERIGGTQSWVSKVECGECRLGIIELREYCRVCGIMLTAFMAALEQDLAAVEAEDRDKGESR